MQIQKLRVRDQKKAIAFAIEGMHFNKFTKNEFLLRLYGRYFWYLAYTDATDVLAAYEGKRFWAFSPSICMAKSAPTARL